MTLIIHAVSPSSIGIRSLCGVLIDGKTATGHYPPIEPLWRQACVRGVHAAERSGDPRMTAKFAPKREDGLSPYVVTKSSWGREWSRIEWAKNLAEAKRQFGWTRQLHAYITVRRATPSDMEIPA